MDQAGRRTAFRWCAGRINIVCVCVLLLVWPFKSKTRYGIHRLFMKPTKAGVVSSGRQTEQATGKKWQLCSGNYYQWSEWYFQHNGGTLQIPTTKWVMMEQNPVFQFGEINKHWQSCHLGDPSVPIIYSWDVMVACTKPMTMRRLAL